MTKKFKALTKTVVAADLAQRIKEHLQRFERSPKINAPKRYDDKRDKWVADKNGLSDYYGAYAVGDRHRVFVKYVQYQSGSYLSIEEAVRYLAWLDEGNIGRHYAAIKGAK